ncbi:MAG: epoxyqueuosine reductase [Candidatus Hermodarchaeota archaeon]
MNTTKKDPAVWVKTIIEKFLNDPAENTLQDKTNQRAWAEPLIGFSNGADPLFQFYKQDIGEFYLLPEELFVYTYPKITFTPEQLTVISWILPHTDVTKAEHRDQTKFPTERWARARIYGEEVNDNLRSYLVKKLTKEGFPASAPILSPLWHRTISDKYFIASTWSERHAAYTAGLGTFGLCDGLITPKGKAMRCGSVIAKINIKPSERVYDDPYAYCLFYMKGTCGDCINRCPCGAISEKGHDKEKCRKYLRKTTQYYVQKYFNFKGYGCGLCQTGVPCESGIPPELLLK